MNKARAKAEDAAPRGVVGIGASAGGLEALQEFLRYLPATTGLTYVIIQHLSPDYKSLLGDILSKHTKMSVLQAEDNTLIEKNKIYLIPPKYNMEIRDGRLHLSEYDHGIINHPIDVFLRSLAKSYANKSVAVILSGTGSDGTNGIKAIKEENGVIIIQSPESSKFDGMPRSALATGFADLVLSPQEMAVEMPHIAASLFARNSEHEAGLKPTDETVLTKIFSILKSISNVNYTYYKQTTILRRIERRMVVTHKENLEQYVDYLAMNPEEAKTLSREVLIGVTSFFRDPEYFAVLKERTIAAILTKAQAHPEATIRVWVPGCSTGEEAYSVAILFLEAMEESGLRHDVKIFATDLDTESIATASRGVYGENIAEDVSISRLSRFFTKKNSKYTVSHDLRKLIIFSPHNVFQDPPFGRLDLISCRNLLIYFQPILQKDLFGIFHMALKDGGFLFLGKSEAINNTYDEVFMPICAKEKIFVHNAEGKAPLKSSIGYSMPMLASAETDREIPMTVDEERRPVHDLYLKALETFMPGCILVNDKNEVQHIFGDASNFIHMPAGKFTADIFTLLTADLRIAVSTALKTAREQQQRVTYTDIGVKGEQSLQSVTLTAMPINDNFGEPSGLTAVVLSVNGESKQSTDAIHYDIDRVAAQRIADLEQELHRTQDDLKRTITELESVNEELQAANEELLTANEELQSSNEELQSVNEELYTVNSEYQQKVEELAGLNDDMSNFLSTTLIGIMFIDSNLHIRKFTNYITEEFNVLSQDVGRPLQYIAYNFMNVDLIRLSQQVATTLVPIERDVVSVNGKPYFLRIAPYRAENNKVLGLVMTFVDTTKQRSDQRQIDNMEQALQRAQRANAEKNSFLSRMSHDMRTPLNAIMGLTYLTMDQPEVSPEVRSNLRKIQDSGQYLLGIITDVLDTSMIESGKVKAQSEPVLEEQLLHEVEDMMLLQAEEQHIFFERSINRCKNECLVMDKAHVIQILVNLLSNAMKFTPENGKVEFITDVEQMDPARVQHIYTISDNGCGMSRQFQKKMYMPFEQENSQQEAASGTGLGLYIVRKLVDMLHGTIECVSQEGKGTTFKVTLTYDVATPEQKSLLTRDIVTDFSVLKGKKILLCDDHELNTEITKYMLENKDMKVICAKNGQEAVQKYLMSKEGELALILMDIRMPVMDGLQATMKIRSYARADAQSIPIIALTANALDEEEHVCIESGMNARLTKPINPVKLYRTLVKYLQRE